MREVLRLALISGLAFGFAVAARGASAPEPDEVRAMVAEILSDSETRSSLLAGGDAGHDGGKFYLAGDDFRMTINGHVQTRYVFSRRDADSVTDSTQEGFQARRTELWLEGNVLKNWNFRLFGEFADPRSPNGHVTLDDAWAEYAITPVLKVKWGQFVLPLLREELVGARFQLTCDRSITNNAFTQSWSKGVQLGLFKEDWRARIAFDEGLNGRTSDVFGPTEKTTTFKVSGTADWAVTGRLEHLFAGKFSQFDDFTSPRGSDTCVLLAVAGHGQQSQDTSNPADVDRDTVEGTVDMQIKGNGWNVFGAFIARYDKLKSATSSPEYYDFGAEAHAGYYVTDKAEIFTRWDAIFADNDRFTRPGPTNFNFLTTGVVYYFAGHAAKWTTDVVWSFNRTQRLVDVGVLPDTGVGLLGQNHVNEFTIRSQFDFLF